jgi:hypothetical protein
MPKTTKKEVAKRDVTKGVCSFCKDEIDKSKMTQHLKYGSYGATLRYHNLYLSVAP